MLRAVSPWFHLPATRVSFVAQRVCFATGLVALDADTLGVAYGDMDCSSALAQYDVRQVLHFLRLNVTLPAGFRLPLGFEPTSTDR